MSNKIASVNNSALLDNKLAVILEELNENLKDSELVEREGLLSQFNEVINKFYKTLNSPLFTIKEFRKGTFPNYTDLNSSFQDIKKDLDILYREVNSLESYIVSNFNTLNTQGAALRGRLRKVSSDLGDFRLHATDNLGGATYFVDSFQNTEKIDYGSQLYNEEICSIDINSGMTTLPVNLGKTKQYSIEETTIGSGSNGAIGNNQELNALLRGELKTISDSNADTWFEYEAVTSEPSAIPLILELKLKLDKDAIINSFDFGSTAFATRNYPRITRLEVSIDGKEFTNIIDQIPTSVVFDGTEERVLILNPAAGKFSGTTRIKMPPVKARYVNVVFQQDDAYIIKTPGGIKYRKAIGIRGIDISGEAFDDIGEVVSTNFTTEDEIKKVMVIGNGQTINGLTNIRHYVSVDDGQNWNEIQSVEKIGRDTKEILNFNLEGVESISTGIPAASIRHKALLERIPGGFTASGGVERRREDKSEFQNISAGTQEINLSEIPISDTVNVKNVSFGSVGRESYHLVNTEDVFERDGFTFVHLPVEPFGQNKIIEDQEIVRINNENWTRVQDITASNGTDKVYEFDYLNNIIKFGDGVTGKQVDGDVYFGLERERVQISQDSPRRIVSSFDIDGVPETTTVYRLGDSITKTGHLLPKAARVMRLNLTDIDSVTITADVAGAMTNEKTFINGSTELIASGDYSVDYLKGFIYTYIETSEDSDTLIDIGYRPRTVVENLTFKEGEVEIDESDYVTDLNTDTLNIAAGTNVIRLSQEFIEPRSLRFLSLSASFKTEVPFIGDGTEFDLGLSASELDGYYTVDYKNGIIYTYSQVVGALVLEYNTTSYYMEYNIAVTVPRDDYTIDEENRLITFTDRYIVKTFSDSLNRNALRSLFKIDYSYVVELESNPRELENFYTPLLKDYALVILTKGQL